MVVLWAPGGDGMVDDADVFSGSYVFPLWQSIRRADEPFFFKLFLGAVRIYENDKTSFKWRIE